MVELDGLAERLFDEGLAGRVVFRDSIGGGRFIGYNDGDGGEIEVLSPEAMSRVEGINDPLAAVRYVAAHEMGHDYVSDRDPREHAMMDVATMGRLAQAGDVAAAREGINLHRERARNASGKDCQFSKYALALISGENMDGGSEFSALGQRYGSGGGAPAAGKKDKSFLGTIKEIYKSIFNDIATMYKPLDNVWENAKGYVKKTASAFLWDTLAKAAGENSPIGEVATAFRNSAKESAKLSKEALSPLARTLSIYSEGITTIRDVYAHMVTDGRPVPLFYTTFEKPEAPNEKKLLDGIEYYKREGYSPMKQDAPAAAVINPRFRTWAAKGFLGEKGYNLTEQEPERMNTRLSMISTDGHEGGMWNRNYDAENALPASCKPNVRVYSTEKSSRYKFGSVFAADLGMNVATAIHGLPLATLERIGGDLAAREYFNSVIMPSGTGPLANLFGGGQWFFKYKKAA